MGNKKPKETTKIPRSIFRNLFLIVNPGRGGRRGQEWLPLVLLVFCYACIVDEDFDPKLIQ